MKNFWVKMAFMQGFIICNFKNIKVKVVSLKNIDETIVKDYLVQKLAVGISYDSKLKTHKVKIEEI